MTIARPSNAVLSFTGLCVALACGALAAVVPGGTLSAGLLVLVGFVLLVALLVTRVARPVDLMVVGAPFMSNLPLTGTLHLALSDALAPLAFLTTAVAYRRADPEDRLQPRQVAYLVLLLLAICVSCMGALLVERGYSFADTATDGMKLLVGFAYLGVVVWDLHTNGRPGLLRILKLWTWTATALAAASVLTALGAAPIIPTDGYRSLGFFGDPNLFGGYLVLSIALVLARTSLAHSRLWLLQLVVLAAGVVTTGSRGSAVTISIVLLGGIVFIRRFGTRMSLLVLGLTLAAGLRILLSQQNSALLGASRLVSASEQVGTDPRLILWNLAVTLWTHSPLTGVGLGQFANYSHKLPYFESSANGYVAHNTYLSLGVETGVLGLGLVLFGLAWIARRLLAYRGPWRDVRTALLLGQVAFMIDMMTINMQNLRYIWMFLGMAVAFPRVAAAVAPVQARGSDQVEQVPDARRDLAGDVLRGPLGVDGDDGP